MKQRSNAFAGAILPVVFALDVSCAAEPAKGGTPTRVTVCDNVLLWRFPETLQIDSTTDEKRSPQTLVTQARINSIALAAAIYCIQFGREYPPGYTEVLRHGSELPPERAGCGLTEDLLEDAWGRPIYYAADGGRLRAVSAGPDGRFATADDIGLPESGTQDAERMDIGQQCARGPSLRRE